MQDLPPYLPKAFVAIEDRRFYSHYGVDPVGIARALVRNVTGKGGMQGGSTLTQQLAKNLFLTQERTVSRKIQEAILALWLEHNYSKDQILELYLNRVYFGSGAYGVEAAALKYFGHSAARRVTLAEAAMLAGLMKAPIAARAQSLQSAAVERANLVIAAMAQEGHITEAMAQAGARPARPMPVKGKDASSLNYAADYVMDMLDDTIGAIDEDIVVTTHHQSRHAGGGREGAATEFSPRTAQNSAFPRARSCRWIPAGAIRALIGGRNYERKPVQSRRLRRAASPAPSFKPFVYLTALEKGLTPDSIARGRAHQREGLAAGKLDPQISGEVTLHHGARAVAEHGGGAARRSRSARAR